MNSVLLYQKKNPEADIEETVAYIKDEILDKKKKIRKMKDEERHQQLFLSYAKVTMWSRTTERPSLCRVAVVLFVVVRVLMSLADNNRHGFFIK